MRNVGALTFANGVGILLGIVQGIIVARILGPSSYGTVALILSVPAFVYGVLDARASDASTKYLGEFIGKGRIGHALAMIKLSFIIDVSVALLAMLLVVLIAPWAAVNIVKAPLTTGLIILQAIALLPGSLRGTSNAVLMTMGSFYGMATIKIVANILRVALIVGLVISGYEIAGVVWGYSMAIVLEAILVTAFMLRQVKNRWGGLFSEGKISMLRSRRQEITRFLLYADVNSTLGLISKRIDLPLLGFFTSPTEVGYYRLAKSIASMVGNLVGPLQSVVYPRLAKLAGLGKPEKVKEISIRYLFQIGTPAAGIIIVGLPIVPILIGLIYGEEFLPSSPAAILLLIGNAFWMLFFWLRPAFFSLGFVKQWMRITALTVAISVLGYLVVIPATGYIGLAAWQIPMQLTGHGLAAAYFFISLRTPSNWDSPDLHHRSTPS